MQNKTVAIIWAQAWRNGIVFAGAFLILATAYWTVELKRFQSFQEGAQYGYGSCMKQVRPTLHRAPNEKETWQTNVY